MHHTWPYIIGWFLRNILRALRCPFSSFNSHMAILFSDSAFRKSLNIMPSPDVYRIPLGLSNPNYKRLSWVIFFFGWYLLLLVERDQFENKVTTQLNPIRFKITNNWLLYLMLVMYSDLWMFDICFPSHYL